MKTITEAIIELSEALGVRSIKDLPGCHECDVDGKWWFAVNGHPAPTKCSRGEMVVSPYCIYIEYNGWPAGVLQMGRSGEDGWFAAHPDPNGANEKSFIAALEAATAKRGRR